MFLQSLYFLPLIFLAIRTVILSICTLAPKVPKARHAESAGGSFFVHKLPKGNIPQSNEPCHSSLSYVFRVLWNSFSYPRAACITSSQTVFAFGELWPHSLCNLQVNLRYARLHKLSHFFRKTYGLSLCPLTVPEVFRSYQCLRFCCLFIRKGYFKENTALSKSQATAAAKGAEKSVKVFLRAVAQLNFHTPA